MRRVLTLVLASFVIAAIAAVATVFLGSLAPSARTDAERPRVQIPILAPGQFAYVENPVKVDGWPSEYLFLRTTAGSLRVFELPTLRGRFTMPDRAWWRLGHVCRVFEPNFSSQEFRCLDPQAPEWVREKFRWTLEGKSIFPEVVEDMLVVQGRVEAGQFVVGSKPEA